MAPNSVLGFGEVVGRLDEIVEAVRSKDTTLDESLDLLDEAIKLGLSAVELVDSPQIEPAERERAGEGAVVVPATMAGPANNV